MVELSINEIVHEAVDRWWSMESKGDIPQGRGVEKMGNPKAGERRGSQRLGGVKPVRKQNREIEDEIWTRGGKLKGGRPNGRGRGSRGRDAYFDASKASHVSPVRTHSRPKH